MQQADGDSFRGCAADALHELGDCRLRERANDSLGRDSLRCLEPQLGRHERGRRPRAGPVELGAGLPADLHHVGESLRCDEGGTGAALLEQAVGRDGHPVREARHRPRVDARMLEH